MIPVLTLYFKEEKLKPEAKTKVYRDARLQLKIICPKDSMCLYFLILIQRMLAMKSVGLFLVTTNFCMKCTRAETLPDWGPHAFIPNVFPPPARLPFGS